MICSNCGHEQANGKFCGRCGTPLALDQTAVPKDPGTEKVYEEQAATTAIPSEPIASAGAGVGPEPSVHLETVKRQTKMYGSYFLQYLKQPSLILRNPEKEFRNGLISIALFAVILALALYTMIRNFTVNAYSFASMFGSGSSGPPFFSIFFGVILSAVVAMAVIIVLLYAINTFFGPGHSIQQMTAIYGAHLLPGILLAVLGFVLFLVKSNVYGNLLILISFAFVIFLAPIFIISTLLSKHPKGVDPLYGFLIYLVAVTITFSILLSIIADSAIGQLIDEISYWL